MYVLTFVNARTKLCLTILAAMGLLIFPYDALASGALSGGGGTGLPFEEGIGALWTSISEFVAPIAVALGVIVGIILFTRGSAGAAVYSLFGFALIGGIALGITEIFNVFGWDGATLDSTKPSFNSIFNIPQAIVLGMLALLTISTLTVLINRKHSAKGV